MENALLNSSLLEIVGNEGLQSGLSVAGVMPKWWAHPPIAVVVPASVEDVVSVVKATEEAGAAVLPVGGGTRIGMGYAPMPGKEYVMLSTGRMKQILDYPPDDLTVTCEPGVTLAELQRTLAGHRQFLPLDSSYPETSTLGGIVSTNASGFWRPAFGSPRDLLIGVRAVMTGGQLIKGGGKVVKNVAGYDVCKLFTGAWGSVGVITELTFKVRSLPEQIRTLAWEAPDLSAAAHLGFALHLARLSAAYFVVTNEPDGTPRLLVGLQGTTRRVEWQAEDFTRRISSAGWTTSPIVLSEVDTGSLLDLQARTAPDITYACRIVCLPSDVERLVASLSSMPGLRLTAHLETGMVSVAANFPFPDAVSIFGAALPREANIRWTRLDATASSAERISVWGANRPDFTLQSVLKKSLDPENTFSPGRFVGQL